jgi:hypothetical protein
VIPGNRLTAAHVQQNVDPDDRQALIDVGLDPDDPSLLAALDLVRWELAHYTGFNVRQP